MYRKKLNVKDLETVLKNLRPEDKEEVELLEGENWYQETFNAFVENKKNSRIIYLDNRTPIAVYGIKTVGDIGIVGLLATEGIHESKLKFLRESKNWINTQLKKHRILTNIVYSRNTLAINWLKWLGFEIEKKYGLGDWFVRFVMRNKECV